MKKIEFTKELIKKIQDTFPEDEKPTVEQVIISLATREYIDNHLDYYKNDQYYMIDIQAELSNFIEKLFDEIKEIALNRINDEDEE
jgi:hypothetical protein